MTIYNSMHLVQQSSASFYIFPHMHAGYVLSESIAAQMPF